MLRTEKMPAWTRASEIILGLVSIFAGVYVLAYPGIAVLTLILLLSVGLIFLGSRDIVVGAIGKILPKWLRASYVAFGLLLWILSIITIAEPGFAVLTLVTLLYVALFIRGAAGISLGAMATKFSKGVRALSIGAGVATVILSVLFLALPGLAVATLIILLSVGLLVSGLEYLAVGAIGRRITLAVPRLRPT